MEKGYWTIRTYTSGKVGEKTKYWIPGDRPTKSSRKLRSEIKKQEENEYSAQKTCARLLNINFPQEVSCLLGLDYSDEGLERAKAWGRSHGLPIDTEDEAERLEAIYSCAEHELRLVLRRVNQMLKKTGQKLKFVAVTSDMDGETGETVRVHHHLVIPRDCADAFVAKWEAFGMGRVNRRDLWTRDDHTPIAAYLIRQVRHRPDAKKYMPSRNLDRPEYKDRVCLSGDAELRVPAGGRLLYRGEYRPHSPQYIRYVLPVKKIHKPPSAPTEQHENTHSRGKGG